MSVDQLRPLVVHLATICQQHVAGWLNANEANEQTVAAALADIVGMYADSAALITADWYEELDQESRFHAVGMGLVDPARIANVAKRVFEGPQSPEVLLNASVQAMVLDASRDTVRLNAASEGVPIARHAQAGACTDCIPRATLAELDRTGRSTITDGFFHPRCTCLYVPVRGEPYTPPDYVKEWHTRVEDARRAGNVNADAIANWLAAH